MDKKDIFDYNWVKTLEVLNWKSSVFDIVKKLKKSLLPRLSNIINPKILKLKKIDQENFYHYILRLKAKKIDITNLSSDEKQKINEIITNNFPIVEITRLTPNEDIVNVSFSWVKKINDVAWQEFCDKIIDELKNYLKQNFKNSKKEWVISRIVKDDYKNLSFVSWSDDILKDIFWDFESKKELIKHIISNLKQDIYFNAQSIINNMVENKIINFSSKKEYEQLVLKKAKEITLIILENLNFWIWETKLWENPTNLEKLDSIRKSEIASKQNVDNDKIEINTYDHNFILNSLRNAVEIENYLIQNFDWVKFSFEWTNFEIITTDINNEKRLSSELLRYVKKYPWKILPKEIVEIILKYYSQLNNSLDFIAPVRWNINDNCFLKAHEINSQIRKWVIDMHYFLKTYKSWFSKNAFLESVKSKKWVSVFIDIKDMWIDNIHDFHLRAKALLKIYTEFEQWIISKDDFEKKQSTIMLEAWKSVTDKFLELQKRILKDYPTAKISFWWDEIYLFIPWSEKIASQKLLNNLTNSLKSAWQKARILIQKNQKLTSPKNTYSFLDRFSKINKIFEIEMEKSLIEHNLDLEKFNPNSTACNFSNEIKQQISRTSFNFSDFTKCFLNKLNWEILYISNSKKIELWEIYEWIKARIIKRQNNTIEIYFYK